jgi:hypothetical protein
VGAALVGALGMKNKKGESVSTSPEWTETIEDSQM